MSAISCIYSAAPTLRIGSRVCPEFPAPINHTARSLPVCAACIVPLESFRLLTVLAQQAGVGGCQLKDPCVSYQDPQDEANRPEYSVPSGDQEWQATKDPKHTNACKKINPWYISPFCISIQVNSIYLQA
ncbi:uncharacterized [Tachysurus ichikawai]